MNAKGKGGCHRHDSDRDGSTVHVDRRTKRNRYRICITVKSHFFTDFHIDWDIGCRTSGEEDCYPTDTEAFKNKRIRVLANHEKDDQWIDDQGYKSHGTNQNK